MNAHEAAESVRRQISDYSEIRVTTLEENFQHFDEHGERWDDGYGIEIHKGVQCFRLAYETEDRDMAVWMAQALSKALDIPVEEEAK